MKNYKYILLFILGLLPTLVFAQFDTKYTPLKYSSTSAKLSPSAFFKKYPFKYNTTDSKHLKEYKKYLYMLHLSYIQGAKEKMYIDEPYFKKYLQRILDTILHANNIKEKIAVVPTRYLAANAYNMGDNKLYVNIGLLKHMENEAEIAFMMAHELSHQLLFHVEKNFVSYQKLKEDKNVKKEIQSINKAKYNKLDRTIQFVKNYEYNFAKYSRKYEAQADSFAVVLISKTDYDISAGTSLMKLLKRLEKDSTYLNIAEYFSTKEQSIDSSFTKAAENPLFFGKKHAIEFDEDSIKTHPDLEHRIVSIEAALNKYKYDKNSRTLYVQNKSLFDSIKTASKFEEIEVFMKNKRYSATVFNSLVLASEFPNNTYLFKNAAQHLHNLVKAVQDHTVQDHMPIESEDLSESYNQFIRLFDRATLVDLQELTKVFLNKYSNKLSSFNDLQKIYDEYNKTKK